jgi:outer membrane protein assembly factor BamB
MRVYASILTKKRHARWALIGALFLALTACASQTTSGGVRGSTPTSYPTLAPWVSTVTPTTVPYSTAAPGTMPHVDGLLYTVTMDGSVLAINPATGTTKWSVSAGTSVGLLATNHALYVSHGDHLDALRPSNSAQLWTASGGGAIADQDGVLYVQRQEGIAALNDLTGATRWTWTPPAEDEFEARLVFGSGVVIIVTGVRGGGGGSAYYGLHALNTSSGATRWERPRGNIAVGVPAIVGDRVYFCWWSNSTGKLGAHTLSTGATLWEHNWTAFNGADGADIRSADSQYIYLGIGEAGLAALRASDGATIWSHDPLTSDEGELYPFAITATSVYIGVGDAIARFDAASGTLIWSQPAAGGGPVLRDGAIYLWRHSPAVAYALDATTGASRWRFPAALTDVIVRNGVLFSHADHDPSAQPQVSTDAIYALNATTGALYWKRDLPSSVAAGPFLAP